MLSLFKFLHDKVSKKCKSDPKSTRIDPKKKKKNCLCGKPGDNRTIFVL